MNINFKKIFWFCSLFAITVISSFAWGNAGKAEFSVHLFQNGLPIENAELMITSESYDKSNAALIFEVTPSTYSWFADADSPLRTNANGSIAGKLPPGFYLFTIQTQDQKFTFDLPLDPAENVQILITFYAGKKKPLLNIESSVTGTMAGVDAAASKPQDQGEGAIAVQVISAETQKPLKDVQVFLSGSTQKLRTDEQGRVTATVPAGSYSISLLHSAYSSQTQDDVKITDEKTTELSFKLTPAGVELAEYVVLEPHLAGTVASVIEEQRAATSVSTVLGAEQFSRAGDGDAASALRRASGLTLVGGQFIFIRGLGERFSTTLVNGAAVPSPDPTRRVVPLDLFPTNILESVLVQKTYSPDRPAEFAGGTVELRTRGIPDAFFFNLNLQTGINDNTTFRDGLTYKGGATDFTSYDDGARALPDSLANATQNGNLQPASVFNPNGVTPGQLEGLGEDLSGVWDVNRNKQGPDTGFQASMGDSFSFGDFRLGYITAAGWKQEFRRQNEINREFASARLIETQDLDVQRSLREVAVTGYAATELEYKDSHRLFAKTMFLRQSVDEARVSQGFVDAETTEVRRTRLRFFSNQLLTNQFGGEHRFDWLRDFSINWLYTDATANRDEPKTRDYRYDASPATGNYIFSQRADSNVITYADLIDKDQSWRVDGKLPLQLTPNHKLTLSSGVITQTKSRDASAQRFSYFRFGPDASNTAITSQSSVESILLPQYIGANGFQLRDVTRKSDQYTASQNLLAYYGKLDLLSYDRVNVTGGLRWEDNDQKVNTFLRNQPTTAQLNRVDMLPSVVTTFFLTDKQQLRAGFSQTLSRPDFRELSSAPFFDMNTNQETVGNPLLKQTAITNWDLRWEYYLSPTENIFAGFFWKDLTNPIELVAQPGTGALNTFQNADKASVYGFELEVLKKLDFVHPQLQNFYVGGNYTWSQSNVKLTAQNLIAQTTNNRSLQGHSEHIVNFQIGYDNPKWKTQATLLYNVASERIMAAGVLSAPDKYEQPFQQLDFVVSQNLYKGLSTQISMQNLLDDDVRIMQGDEISRQFRRGRFFNLSVRLAY
ncbi:MAG: TonB-dependent receptor [Nitrosomonas sp.]|uniref:TonB-dependent receptor domain-containing protein n=1 Tax=Nitrosomonas sp. TaxID=42353 RepID=UPI0025E82C6C|nr:TonB-dependent receptor [Nitrosomonas sp.]MBY0474007.1 TonB-dependent receptor [Nitrosomonas sp.]